MTARTHDLGAFTALTLAFHALPLVTMTPATLITLIFANMLGGLFPDLDESSARFWKHLRGGTILGKLIGPLMGGHRLITHSIIGIILTGYALAWFTQALQSIILVDMNLVWWAFMLGMVSHLVLDSFTKDGIPLFFPLPFKIGFPPLKKLRIKTGSIMEKGVVFPALAALNFYLLSTNYSKLLDFLRLYLQ
jgi:inner membrane protein